MVNVCDAHECRNQLRASAVLRPSQAHEINPLDSPGTLPPQTPTFSSSLYCYETLHPKTKCLP